MFRISFWLAKKITSLFKLWTFVQDLNLNFNVCAYVYWGFQMKDSGQSLLLTASGSNSQNGKYSFCEYVAKGICLIFIMWTFIFKGPRSDVTDICLMSNALCNGYSE